MDAYYHARFLKDYRKRIFPNKKLIEKVKKRVSLFIADPFHKSLKNHPLMGKKSDVRAFSITGDIRIIYKQVSKTKVIFIDIGTHNQVY